jgi:hypothetical protein
MGDQECSNKKLRQKGGAPIAKQLHFCSHTDLLFFLNLVWIIVLGVGILYWIGSFTGHLETAIGLLGLGGIFAWLAFFLNLVREERKKQLQLMFDELLRLKTISVLLAVFTGILVMIAWNRGCIIIDSSRDTLDRSIHIRPAVSKKAYYSTNIWSRLKAKFPVRTGFSGRKYEIDLEGLPLIRKTVRPFSRLRLKVPSDLLRSNVVLVHPSVQLTGTSSKAVGKDGPEHLLVVRLDGNDVSEIPFYGQTVWIGSGKPLNIPASLKEKWKIEVAANEKARLSTLLHWFEPTVLTDKKISELKSDQKLEVFVKKSDGERLASTSPSLYIVKQCDSENEFPKILPLNIDK